MDNFDCNKNIESKLWIQIKKGDLQALGDLYNIYADRLYSYGIRRSRDKDLIMDCIHDLFLDLYKYRKKLSCDVNVQYYLYKSLSRKISKQTKSKLTTITPEEDTNNKYYKNQDVSTEERIINSERVAEISFNLSRAVKMLTPKQKLGVSMRYIENKSYEEIAANLNISIETARTLIFRSIKSLRQKLS